MSEQQQNDNPWQKAHAANAQDAPSAERRSFTSRINPVTIVVGLLVVVIVAGTVLNREKAPNSPDADAKTSANAAAGKGGADDAAAGDTFEIDPDMPLPPGVTRKQAAAMMAIARKNAMKSGGGGASNYNALKATLRGLAMAQEIHYNDRNTYTNDLSALEHIAQPGVVVTIVEATNTGWSAKATLPGLKGSCVIKAGHVTSPATTTTGLSAATVTDGAPLCDPV